MLNWKFENDTLIVKNKATGKELSLGRCEGLDGEELAKVLNLTPFSISKELVPLGFIEEEPKVVWMR